ncbi:MAG: hypothetical protein [Caudoviricetes sp.]|nr:MAG: hypothetical protein [Caudoviricetes sp.]
MKIIDTSKGGTPKYNFIDGDGRSFKAPYSKVLTGKAVPSVRTLNHVVSPFYNEALSKKVKGITGPVTFHMVWLPEFSSFNKGLITVNPYLTDGAAATDCPPTAGRAEILAGLSGQLQFALYENTGELSTSQPVGTATSLTTSVSLAEADTQGVLRINNVFWKVPDYPSEIFVPEGHVGVISFVMQEGPEKNMTGLDYSDLETTLQLSIPVSTVGHSVWE